MYILNIDILLLYVFIKLRNKGNIHENFNSLLENTPFSLFSHLVRLYKVLLVTRIIFQCSWLFELCLSKSDKDLVLQITSYFQTITLSDEDDSCLWWPIKYAFINLCWLFTISFALYQPFWSFRVIYTSRKTIKIHGVLHRQVNNCKYTNYILSIFNQKH